MDLNDYWSWNRDQGRSNQSAIFVALWDFYGRSDYVYPPTELRAHPVDLVGVRNDGFPGVKLVEDDRCEPGRLYIKGDGGEHVRRAETKGMME